MLADKVYIHELIDIRGSNRARYQHHMTANWVPAVAEERRQRCFGVWGTVGSTGAWPQVVNLWEIDGWEGLAADFEHELAGPGMQDSTLAAWWAVAAELRRGGFDRILEPAVGNRTIDELVAAGVRGTVYAHEMVSLPPGAADTFLDALADEGSEVNERHGLELVGAWRVAMVNDSEAVVIWALPDHVTWVRWEQAWRTDADLVAWRARLVDLGADWRRTLMVDAELSPMRLGRQPLATDRRPLDEV